jgi:hypothetical protein
MRPSTAAAATVSGEAGARSLEDADDPLGRRPRLIAGRGRGDEEPHPGRETPAADQAGGIPQVLVLRPGAGAEIGGVDGRARRLADIAGIGRRMRRRDLRASADASRTYASATAAPSSPARGSQSPGSPPARRTNPAVTASAAMKRR